MPIESKHIIHSVPYRECIDPDESASPIPFGNLHLPYTPLFDPVGGDVAPNGTIIGGGGGGSGAPLAHGPASVAASAIIGPTPGGVAGKLYLSKLVSCRLISQDLTMLSLPYLMQGTLPLLSERRA